jgi:hypothetical protein
MPSAAASNTNGSVIAAILKNAVRIFYHTNNKLGDYIRHS